MNLRTYLMIKSAANKDKDDQPPVFEDTYDWDSDKPQSDFWAGQPVPGYGYFNTDVNHFENKNKQLEEMARLKAYCESNGRDIPKGYVPTTYLDLNSNPTPGLPDILDNDEDRHFDDLNFRNADYYGNGNYYKDETVTDPRTLETDQYEWNWTKDGRKSPMTWLQWLHLAKKPKPSKEYVGNFMGPIANDLENLYITDRLDDLPNSKPHDWSDDRASLVSPYIEEFKRFKDKEKKYHEDKQREVDKANEEAELNKAFGF